MSKYLAFGVSFALGLVVATSMPRQATESERLEACPGCEIAATTELPDTDPAAPIYRGS